jgi:hypothetical protein
MLVASTYNWLEPGIYFNLFIGFLYICSKRGGLESIVHGGLVVKSPPDRMSACYFVLHSMYNVNRGTLPGTAVRDTAVLEYVPDDPAAHGRCDVTTCVVYFRHGRQQVQL